ncbi:MAG: thioredoxin fold domain-containing protein [Candidatus Thiodiazotropha sp. (ex Lucina aurantia)]|nr:thioredoxin fold domain-containing protein [Candidatus Thiodiazotropha sp. (ex Lucina pensylvanica)]MBT3023637.1 thioredoxin fold domain-containing protein [Candidatus Thiodiazotropha taylori]MBV2100785.1 thioredoxin fold domain-containing protein [Candidatus Thiodiazotropha sp. (ex Codakia orbicularis)]MBV2104514.1 thioredoxin fold domain-containing protein [Candidatus Thiodiazotropha sp. (ex Lucina aurantia)]MBV2119043.1 thioredoxin fold domain-containing protein [Candidatus Thiodiazotroph
MLKLTILSILLLFAVPQLQAAGDQEGLGQGLVNPGFHDKPAWFKNSFLDLQEDLQEAAEEDKRVILYFHQDGCPYCAKLLNENFSIKAIVDKTQQAFQLVAINIWGDREVAGLSGEATTEKAFAASMKVMYTPTMLFLNEQGRRVLRINGYYAPHRFMAALDYVAGREERKLSFRDYLARIQPVASTGKLHRESNYLQSPMDLRRPSGADRPLLVLMEMKQCPPCDELHQEILPQSALQESLQGFDVALVDIWSGEELITPDGKRMKATKWAESLGIQYAPSMLFFDGSGREVFRSEAYLRSFHTHAVIDYVGSGSYRDQPNFQRFVQARADEMRARGEVVDLMK